MKLKRELHQADGVKALDGLAASLKSFDGVLEAKDKQGIPGAAADALKYVGDAEAALVKGFPYEVPSEFANLPQLKVSAPMLRLLCGLAMQPAGIRAQWGTFVAAAFAIA